MNQFVDIVEVLIGQETHDIGIRFGDGDTHVLPPRAAASLGRGLLDAAALDERKAVSPAKARWS